MLALEEGRLVRFSFQIGRPREKSGEVEVRFEPLGDKSCRVTLIHDHWERFGDEAVDMHGRFSNGWDDVFVKHFGDFAGRA